LANLGGSLSLEAFRYGEKMAEPPVLVRRPDPFISLREFVRDSIYTLAMYGECLWYVGARDGDGNPISLRVTNPVEWTIAWDAQQWGRVYTWRNREIKPRDVIHLTFSRDLGSPRGAGPLQLCGAALSVAQAADDWAATFYAFGGTPSVVLKVGDELDPEEAAELKAQWTARANGEPAVLSGDMDAKPFGLSPEQGQLNEARTHSTGDVARAFGIPGHLLEYAVAGSSLTYQNIGEVGAELVRFTLAPGYLEPIEVAISDLLTRSTVARFNVEGILRADIKTRFEVYSLGIASGVLSPADGQRAEGLIPGGVETAPMPANPATVEVIPNA
jgi:HK97 family phage portal protein